MKAASALVFSTVVSTSQAQNEHGVLLQVMSGHKTSAGSTLDKTAELQTLINGIAKENEGKAVKKDMKGSLEEIATFIGSMQKQLGEEHKKAQDGLAAAFEAFNTCNTDAKSETVTAALKAANDARVAHDTCRGKEVLAYGTTLDDKSGACPIFHRAAVSAMQCSATPDSGKIAEHNRVLGIFAKTSGLSTKKKACADGLTAYKAQNKQCKADQLAAEEAVCKGHLKSSEVCGKLDGCFAGAKKTWDQTCKDMTGPRDTRQTQAKVLKSLKCKIEKLLKSLTDGAKLEDFASCKVDDDADLKKKYDIQCRTDLPKQEDCTRPDAAEKGFAKIYSASKWFDVATNDVEKQERINVQHECDKVTTDTDKDEDKDKKSDTKTD